MFGEYVPETDSRYYCYNQIRNDIEAYSLPDADNSNVYKIGDLIETPRIANSIDILIKWIQHSASIFIVGPPASGKRLVIYIINYIKIILRTFYLIFSKIILKCSNVLRGIQCVTIHCSAHTSPEQVLLKMSQVNSQ